MLNVPTEACRDQGIEAEVLHVAGRSPRVSWDPLWAGGPAEACGGEDPGGGGRCAADAVSGQGRQCIWIMILHYYMCRRKYCTRIWKESAGTQVISICLTVKIFNR